MLHFATDIDGCTSPFDKCIGVTNTALFLTLLVVGNMYTIGDLYSNTYYIITPPRVMSYEVMSNVTSVDV